MQSAQTKLKLPQLRRVGLRRFSLFTANPDVEFDCCDGVVCLIGANGIGKSTLLSAINFCLTGIVSDPNRAFTSMEEYYRFTRNYSSSYFVGRIVGSDEDDAEINVSFRLGHFDYSVRRGIFEPDELRGLTISNSENQEIVIDTEERSRAERHNEYVTHLVEHTGVSSFEEFAFLQHFVFTFDEQRKTLFWNPRIMERVIYRAFGMDPNMAKQVDTMRREMQHEDSRVRNYQWEATRLRNRINGIRALAHKTSGAKEQYETLTTDHEGLTRQFDEETRLLREAEDSLKDAHLRLAEESVRETTLRDEYARCFDQNISVRPPLSQHPLVMQSLNEHACGLCGSLTDAAIFAIKHKVQEDTCPLCNSPLPEAESLPDDTNNLQRIDRELSQAKKAIRNVLKAIERLRVAEASARQQCEATKRKLDDFDNKNSTTLDSLRHLLDHGAEEASLDDYRRQLAVLEDEKKTAFEKRENLKARLLIMQKELEQQYVQAEQSFVQPFSDLAHRFLGMPLNVQMETKATGDVSLVISVRGTTRRQQQNLSESQRFFLDIALRMALIKHMSDPASPGGIFIDTPEGSLDIAYEKRAGDMLAMFAEAGYLRSSSQHVKHVEEEERKSVPLRESLVILGSSRTARKQLFSGARTHV